MSRPFFPPLAFLRLPYSVQRGECPVMGENVSHLGTTNGIVLSLLSLLSLLGGKMFACLLSRRQRRSSPIAQ